MSSVKIVRFQKYGLFGLVLKRSPIRAFLDPEMRYPGSIRARIGVARIWRLGVSENCLGGKGGVLSGEFPT